MFGICIFLNVFKKKYDYQGCIYLIKKYRKDNNIMKYYNLK